MTRSFVTFVKTDDYVPGILALKRSLDIFTGEHPFVIMTTNLLSARAKATLQKAGCQTRQVSEIDHPLIPKDRAVAFNHYTKLRVYEMTEYEKIVFLDADMIVTSDISPLFDAPHMSAVVAGGLIPHFGWTQLNGGLMVIEPSEELFARMYAAVPHLPSEDGTDQGFLHSFYPDWPQEKHLHLSHAYNVPVSCLDAYCEDHGFAFSYSDQLLETNISVLHYWGPVKPWQINAAAGELDQLPKLKQAIHLWWDLYASALGTLEQKYRQTY